MKKGITLVVVLLCVSMSLLACGGKNTGTGDNKQTQAQMSWQEQYELGIRLLNEGKYEDAILAFQAAIQIDPKNAGAYLGLAEVYASMGNLDSASKTVQQGLNSCGNTYMELFIEISKTYNIPLEWNGETIVGEADWDEIYEAGRRLLEQGQYADAVKELEKAITLDPACALAYEALAEAYMQMGQEDKVLEILQKGIDASSGSARKNLIAYAEKLGYMLDENGKLVKFDEKAYVAGLSRYEQLKYYFEKDDNATHWIFEDGIVLNGREGRTLVTEDIMAMSVELGWGEMYEYTAMPNAAQTGGRRAYNPFAYVQGLSANLDGSSCFTTLMVGNVIGNYYSDNGEQVYATKPATGIEDIHFGDSFTSVLAALGFEHAEEIGGIVCQDSDEQLGEYSGTYYRDCPTKEEDLEQGAKRAEELSIEFTESDGMPYVWLQLRIHVEGAQSEWIWLGMHFDVREDYSLVRYSIRQSEMY